MPIYNLSLEKIEEFENKLASLNKELKVITSKTPIVLWSDDLKLLLVELKKFGYTISQDSNVSTKKKLKIKAT